MAVSRRLRGFKGPLNARVRRSCAMAGLLAFGCLACGQDIDRGVGESQAGRGSREPASLVLVVIDTLRADHLGAYGYSRDVSTMLDARTDSAVVFEHVLAPSPWTLPSMASMLTGRYPVRHGAGLRARSKAESRAGYPTQPRPTRHLGTFARLHEDVPVLAEVLSEAGYSTAATVTNHFLDPVFGMDRGFETYDAPVDTLAGRNADWVVDQALALLDGLPRPYFLLVHLFDPHVPYGAPEPFAGRYTGAYEGRLELPFQRAREVRTGKLPLDEADRRFLVDAYDEQIAFAGFELDRLLARLLDGPEAGSTIVVLTSDHGEEFFEHGGFEHGHSVFQEVLRVPWMMWGPEITAGRIERPVSLVDLAPTVIEALGLEQPARMDGQSLWPAVKAGREPEARPIAAQWNLYGADRSALVDWPYKLVLGANLTPVALYDLSSDAAEVHDRAGDLPDEVARILTLAETMMDPAQGILGEEADVDEDLRQKLEALGYLN